MVKFVALLNNNFSKKSLCSFSFPQANEFLQSFMQAQAETMECILQADQDLTAREKALEGTGQGSKYRGEEGFLHCPVTCQSKFFLKKVSSQKSWQILAKSKNNQGSFSCCFRQSVPFHHIQKHVLLVLLLVIFRDPSLTF